MGKVTVDIRLENAVDWVRAQGDGETQRRHAVVTAHVDTGTTDLCIPEETARLLGLREVRQVELVLADGSEVSAPVIGPLRITILGRSMMHEAVVLPEGTEPLMGVIPMGGLDLIVDPRSRQIRPRDERGPRLSAK